jgi:lipopolysaccharide heptosyltransferase II
MSPLKAILVLRFSAVGDVVLTAPALAALRAAWPNTKILFAVNAGLAPVVAHNPHVDDVYALGPRDSALDVARWARQRGAEAVLDLHGKLKSRLVRLALADLPAVSWTKRRLQDTLAVKLKLRPYRSDVRLADRYHHAVEALVGQSLPHGPLRFWTDPDETEPVAAILKGAGLRSGHPVLGMNPGANWATKRWPTERFAELARRVQAKGWQVAINGSAEEAGLGAQIVEAAPGVVDLCGKLTLNQLGSFLAGCTAFLANDTGPMHIARALGVPTLAIFGSTDPSMFSWTGHGYVFNENLPCAPCSFYGRRSCPRRHFRCLLEVSADAVWEKLLPLLDGKLRGAVSA